LIPLALQSRTQIAWVGSFTQTDLAEAFPTGVVKEDTVFVAGPDRVVLEKARALDMKEDAARFAAANNQPVFERGLGRVEMVFEAENLMDVFQKQIQSR